MDDLLIYYLKMIATSVLLVGYYFLFLKDKTFHHYNRFYILGMVLLSLVLPLIKVSYFTIPLDQRIYILMSNMQTYYPSAENTSNQFYLNIILGLMILVILFFLIKLGMGIYHIYQLMNKYPGQKMNGFYFYNTDLQNAPFSFFKNLFWKNSIHLPSDLGRQILKHEMVHIEQNHTMDKLFLELVKAIFWLNPIFWWAKKEMSLIHEYLADKKAVKNADTKAFAQMLLASHFTGIVLPGSSPFLSSNLKKRLKMLQQPKTKYGYARRVLALPMIFGVVFFYIVNAENANIEKTNQEIIKMVEQVNQRPIQQTPKQDTEIINEDILIKNNDEIKSDFEQKIQESNEKSIFLIDEIAVTRDEFINFYQKTKNSKDYLYYQSKVQKKEQEKSLKINERFCIVSINSNEINRNHGDESSNEIAIEKKEKKDVKFIKQHIKENGTLALSSNEENDEKVKGVSYSANTLYSVGIDSFDEFQDIKEANEKDFFLIDGKKKTKSEFTDFFNKSTKKDYTFLAMKMMNSDEFTTSVYSLRKKGNNEEEFNPEKQKLFTEHIKTSALETKNLVQLLKTKKSEKKSNAFYINSKNATGNSHKIFLDDKEITSKDFDKIEPNSIKEIKIRKDNNHSLIYISSK